MAATTAGAELSDEQLIEAVGRGDSAALTALYERYHHLALHVASRTIADPGYAEDAVQEAFMAVLRYAERYQVGRLTPRAWLLMIVRQRALNQLRRSRLLQEHCDGGVVDIEQPEVWLTVAHSLRRDTVRAALTDLPASQRLAVELAFFNGLSHSEIARQLQLPLGTVKSRLRMALHKLRLSLHEEALQLTA